MRWKRALTWIVEFDDRARRELRRLDPRVQRNILQFFRERIATDEDPKRFGKPLRSTLKGLWRYRFGDYRMVCRVEDQRLTVLVLSIGHRSSIYR